MGLNHTDMNALIDPCEVPDARAGEGTCTDLTVLNTLLRSIVDTSVVALFCDDANLAAAPPVRSVDAGLVGTLGFVGPTMRGALLFEIPVATARIAAGIDDDDAVRDWVGEMTNQLLGRVKNRLLGHGLDFCLSTPMVISGCALDIPPGRGVRVTTGFASERGRMRVIFEYVSTPDLAFVLESTEVAAEEGAALFF